MNDQKLSLILAKLEAMENEQLEMKKAQLNMHSDLKSIKEHQEKMKSDIKEIKQTQKSLIKKSDVIIEQVVRNSEDITYIKENQQIIADIVKRQEDTINILARRSIDQEAEIKRIK